MCNIFCPISDKKAIISIKKQACFRLKSGAFSTKKWPSNFSKAYLLHDNVNIVYLRHASAALRNSISSENPDKTLMTHCHA